MRDRTCAWGGCDSAPAPGRRYCPPHQQHMDQGSNLEVQVTLGGDLFSGLHGAPKDPGAGERMRHPVAPPAPPDPHGHGLPPATQALPYVAGNANSEAAAKRAQVLAQPQRRKVYDATTKAGHRGMTRRELEDALDMRGSSVHPRVLELLDSGHLVESTAKRDGSAILHGDAWAQQCPTCQAGNPAMGQTRCARCTRKAEQATAAPS